MNYQEFIDLKRLTDSTSGLTEIPELNPQLFEGRKFVGVELKDSYYKQAVANLHAAKHQQNTLL